MKRNFFAIAATVVAGTMLFACTNEVNEAPKVGGIDETRAAIDAPIVQVYYEINDTNPLNALSYNKADGTKFISIVQLFAANIHKDANGDPTIYFNDKLAPVMADVDRFVRPLQAAGIKVCLTTLGDWQGNGLANFTDAQAEKFAAILAYIVDRYGLDGINFDDEYSNYSTPLVSGSFGNVITKLRAKLGPDKLINAFQWGNYGSTQINAAAGALLDFADHGSFGPTYFNTASSIQGVTNDRWMPMAINMGSSYTLYLTTIKNNAARVASQNYGGVMMFNVRKASQVNPLPVFNAICQGLYGMDAVYTGTEYAQDWTFIPAGYEITYADAAGF